MRGVVLAVAVLSVGCSWSRATSATAIAGAVTIVCDWAQTRDMAARRWVRNGTLYNDANPIMGPWPSTRTVDAYFASAAAIGALAWLALPEKLRPFWGGSVAAVQSRAVARNVETSGTVCGE